jgi:predicted metal-dependent hydrolase
MRYAYTVIRSKRRTLALEVTTELTVRVRAPLRASDRSIRQLVENNESWIEKTLEKQKERGAARPRLNDAEIAALKRKAAEHIPPRVAHYADVMGLQPTGVKITGAEKRYGSCSGKNSLCFSYRLMLCPDAAVDFVVVHELAHIRHKNHGRDFYALIASVLPDYKQRRKLLKA